MFMRWFLWLLFVLIAIQPLRVGAQDDPHGNRGEGHDTWHGTFYQGLVTPETKVSCCNLADCRPTTGTTKDGKWFVMINGKLIEVLQSKIVNKTAPDWGFHVCAPQLFDENPEHVYCVVLPTQG
jgi:hypothetical protein